MASGHVNRIKRPNTWLHRPMLQNVKKALAKPEPSTHGFSDMAKRPDDVGSLRQSGRLLGISRSVSDPERTFGGSLAQPFVGVTDRVAGNQRGQQPQSRLVLVLYPT
jgi:hypothetical protein